MLEQVGYFIGMAVADVVHFFRGRQAVPCLVEWQDMPQAVNEWGAATLSAGNARYYSPATVTVSNWPGKLRTDDCCSSCDNGCWSDDPTA